MSEHLYSYITPTTMRSADILATHHGAANVDDLLNKLPDEGRFLDIGAGDSTLGVVLAKRGLFRGIRVTIFDIAEPVMSEEIPENLKVITGDALRLTDYIEYESSDMTVSYFMLPHFDPDRRRQAISGMYDATRVGGKISIGPWTLGVRGLRKAIRSLHAPARQFIKDASTSPREIDGLVSEMASGVRIPPQIERAYLAFQRARSEVFETNRSSLVSPDGHRLIFDYENQTFCPLRSARGCRIAGHVAHVATVNYLRDKN